MFPGDYFVYMETPTLLVNGCKIKLRFMVDAFGYRAGRVPRGLYRATPAVKQDLGAVSFE